MGRSTTNLVRFVRFSTQKVLYKLMFNKVCAKETLKKKKKKKEMQDTKETILVRNERENGFAR